MENAPRRAGMIIDDETFAEVVVNVHIISNQLLEATRGTAALAQRTNLEANEVIEPLVAMNDRLATLERLFRVIYEENKRRSSLPN